MLPKASIFEPLPVSDADQEPEIPVIPAGAVLIVDDERINRMLLTQQVARLGRRVLAADNGKQALEILRTDKCDLILLDVLMPEMNGVELLETIKKDPQLKDIPAIVISGLDEMDTAVRCIETGAEDFLNKPFDPVLLRARISASLEKKSLRDRETAYMRQLIQLKQSLADRNRELEDANNRLARAALTDVLTGLPNRRFAIEELGRAWAASVRHDKPLSCLVVDIDYFKKFNDLHGHDAGDAVLQGVANRLRNALRTEEVVCRFGGEEFVVVCQHTDHDGAMQCGERLRFAVADGPIEYLDNQFNVTISVGVASRTPNMEHFDHLLKEADRAVYAAKQAGRNRICVAPDAA